MSNMLVQVELEWSLKYIFESCFQEMRLIEKTDI